MDNKVLRKAINTYGYDNQMMQTIEESAELIQAINKYFRAVKNQNGIQEAICDMIGEVADCAIMLEQMKIILGYEVVEEVVEAKLKRLEGKIQKKEV